MALVQDLLEYAGGDRGSRPFPKGIDIRGVEPQGKQSLVAAPLEGRKCVAVLVKPAGCRVVEAPGKQGVSGGNSHEVSFSTVYRDNATRAKIPTLAIP